MAQQRAGRLPNVFWQAVSFEELRREPRFDALPPVHDIHLAGPPSYRFVRQEDELWSELHAGLLTTGRLAAALGFYERSAVKRLGLKNSRASHGELVAAYHHLLSPPYAPASDPRITPAAATAQNAAAVAAFNAELASEGRQAGSTGPARTLSSAAATPAVAPAVPATTAPAERLASRPGSAVTLGSLAAEEGGPRAAAELADGDGRGGSDDDATSSPAALLDAKAAPALPAVHAGGGSSSSSRRRQKKKQQAAQAASTAVAAVPGAPPSLLEPQAAAEAGTASSTGGGGSKKHRRKKKGAAAAAAAAAAVAPVATGAAGQQAAVDPIEELKLRKARYLSQAGLMSICCAWGNAQEAAAVRVLLQLFPLCQLAEVGLCHASEADLAALGFDPGSLPPLGASPDALIRHRRTAAPAQEGAGASSGEHSGSVPSGPAPDALPTQLAGLALGLAVRAGAPADPGCCSNGTASCGASSVGSGASETQGWWEEIVEVKNSCPFGIETRPRGGRAPRSLYQLHDRGPRLQVAPEWVPQLQLHMLCAGTQSGLLVSRSATKGVRVFRMQRSDAYLRSMLAVVSRLWLRHVALQSPPAADAWASWADHHRLLDATRVLAAGAQLVAEAESASCHTPFGDDRMFLD